jgi:putative glutamine amidotransferase
VTTSEVRLPPNSRPLKEGDPPQREMALGLPYLKAIEHAGGLPVVLPPLETTAIPALLDRLSGVCLSGGPDLDPAGYGAAAHAELGDVEPDLDRFELEVAKEADRRGMPVLGICRGLQALNVARGGTLHQHLADVTDGTVDHRQTLPGTVPTHDVTRRRQSRLAGILGTAEVRVNSFHHQAVDRLGTGLRAVAWAPDGVVEGVESEDGAAAGCTSACSGTPRGSWPTPRSCGSSNGSWASRPAGPACRPRAGRHEGGLPAWARGARRAPAARGRWAWRRR